MQQLKPHTIPQLVQSALSDRINKQRIVASTFARPEPVRIALATRLGAFTMRLSDVTRACEPKEDTSRALFKHFFPMAQQPLVGQGVLIIEALRSQSVGLPWTSDQPDAETCT